LIPLKKQACNGNIKKTAIPSGKQESRSKCAVNVFGISEISGYGEIKNPQPQKEVVRNKTK